MDYDFEGWATKNDLRCSDGRVIRRNAFKECDGKTVPLVWQHDHNDPSNVLGHALLENRDEGVYVYGSFNNTARAIDAKELIEHKDIVALSIYANNLQQNGHDVLHGAIREVSLVYAGANPGAFIVNPRLAHSDEFNEDEAIIYSGEELCHSSSTAESETKKEDTKVADETKKTPESENDEETVKDVFDTLTDKQKNVVYFMIGQALEDKAGASSEAKHSDIEEDNESMKENIFDRESVKQSDVICHADQEMIIKAAKEDGSFQRVMKAYMEENELQHDALASGFAPNNIGNLFPEYKDVRPGAPELVTDDNGWVEAILRKVHKSPFSRIRTSQVDIRHINDLRARGYQKGKQKAQAGNYQYVKRETDPQTVYVKSALHRDDVIDITDFDYVQYQYNIDQIQLREELATAMLLGDGRVDGTDDKIDPNHIRPVYGDNELFTIYKDLGPFMTDINGDYSGNFGDNYKYAEASIAALLDAKIDFRGTGTQDMFCTQQYFNKMMLAKDLNGRRIYANKAELCSALGVNDIYPVSKMAGVTRTKTVTVDGVSTNKTMACDAIIINWADYSMGSTKGGQISHFTDFDIDFNQLKSLLETRCSGANTRIYSCIVLEEEVA